METKRQSLKKAGLFNKILLIDQLTVLFHSFIDGVRSQNPNLSIRRCAELFLDSWELSEDLFKVDRLVKSYERTQKDYRRNKPCVKTQINE